MSKIDNALSTVFGIDTIPQSSQANVVEYNPPAATPYVAPELPPEDEFDEVKENIETLIDKGTTALESLTDIAVAEESPRAFEVLNTMLGTISDLSMKLVELEERKAKLKKLRKEISNPSDESDNTPHTVNNSIVFVGTTDDLHDQIAKRLMEKK